MKLSPQQARIIAELEQGPLNTGDFMNRECPSCGAGKGLNIVNFSQRITELKRMGYPIRSKQLKVGLWQYWLEDSPMVTSVQSGKAYLDSKEVDLMPALFNHPAEPKRPNPYNLDHR